METVRASDAPSVRVPLWPPPAPSDDSLLPLDPQPAATSTSATRPIRTRAVGEITVLALRAMQLGGSVPRAVRRATAGTGRPSRDPSRVLREVVQGVAVVGSDTAESAVAGFGAIRG